MILFNLSLKDNIIYAYGLLDGYNGTYAVDTVDRTILSDMYFEHLISDEQNKFQSMNKQRSDF